MTDDDVDELLAAATSSSVISFKSWTSPAMSLRLSDSGPSSCASSQSSSGIALGVRFSGGVQMDRAGVSYQAGAADGGDSVDATDASSGTAGVRRSAFARSRRR